MIEKRKVKTYSDTGGRMSVLLFSRFLRTVKKLILIFFTNIITSRHWYNFKKRYKMARNKKNLNKIDGWIAIDKPVGMGSTTVVSAIKRILRPQKVGHAGTLDPLASGMLPIALGEATKTVQFAMDKTKIYEFEVKWGEATSTDDAEGEIVETSDVRPSTEQIEKIIPEFIGEIEQVPPVYSAIKINGKRAYDLARRGEEVELKPRKVKLDSVKLIENDEKSAKFEVICGKGFYIRSLARDIAKRLGTCGYVTYLRRTKCGAFDKKNAILLEVLEKLVHSSSHLEFILPVQTVLDDILALALTEQETKSIRQGKRIKLCDIEQFATQAPVEGALYQALFDGKLVALTKVEKNILKPVRVMNL
jgi:tRNA pseudouridine55 synthase